MSARKKTNNTNIPQPSVAPVTPAPDAMGRLWARAFTISLWVVFALMTVMSFSFGITGDEIAQNRLGEVVLSYYTTLGADTRALSLPPELDKDGVLQYYGGLFDLIAVVVAKISPFEHYTTRHILNAWAGFVAVLFAARIAVRIGGKRMGVLTIWLMFLAPFFLGHAMNNPKDIPFAAAYIAAIYYLLRFYDKLPSVTWKDYIVPILILAAAIDIRVAGILLIPYMFVYFALDYVYNKDSRASAMKRIKAMAIVGVLGYFCASLLWPYALQNPVSNPLKALEELSNFKMNLRQMYEGERIFSNDLPPSYLVKMFFITNSYILIAGLLLAPVALLKAGRNKAFTLALFIAFITVFPVAYIIYKESNVYHAWRHVLFIFPGAAIMAAYGLNVLWEWAQQPVTRYAVAGLTLLGFMEPLVFTVKTFPQTATYYNVFSGGMEEAYDNYEMDFYYNSMKEAADWFIKNEVPKIGKDSVFVASNHSDMVAVYLKDYPNIHVDYVRFPERSYKDWDYLILHRALIPEDRVKNRSWLINQTIYQAAVNELPLTIVVKRPSMDDYYGFKLLEGNRIGEAIDKFRQYRQVDPGNELVNSIMARYYLSVAQPDSAQMMVNEVLRITPGDMQAQQLGAQAAQMKQYGNSGR